MLNLLPLLLCFTTLAFSQAPLEEYSRRLNESLPEIYDPVTKLRRTSVENHYLVYHFLVDATSTEYKWALPKVKAQILMNVCKNAHQKNVLKNFRTGIIYRYENVKGQSLGEFLIPPSTCKN